MEHILVKRRITSIRENIRQSICRSIASFADIIEIATEIFGEDRVDATITGENCAIVIYFPEITITNGKKDGTRVLHDLFAKVYIENQDQIRVVRLSGTRSTIQLDEWQVGYCHSHLPVYSYKGKFQEFCIGIDSFYDLTARLKEYTTSYGDNWYLYFYNLLPYLSWESLNGGPFICMDTIRQAGGGMDTVYIVADLLPSVIKSLPDSCLYISEHQLCMNSMDANLLDLYDQLYKRGGTSQDIMHNQSAYAREFETFNFKGNPVIPKLIQLGSTDNQRMPEELINQLNQELQEKITSFNIYFTHEHNKELYGALLGDVPVF